MTKITSDNNKYIPASQFHASDAEGMTNVLPLDTDWIPLNPTNFTPQDTYIACSFNALGKFSIGDRLRIRPVTAGAPPNALTSSSDGYYYLSVFAVTAGKIYISNYDFIPNDIQVIEFSKFQEPTNWPYQLLNNSLSTSPFWFGDGTLNLGGDIIEIAYRQLGRELTIDSFSIGFEVLSGSGATISMSFPFGNNIVSLTEPPAALEFWTQIINVVGPGGVNIPTIVTAFNTIDFKRADGLDWSSVGYYSIPQGIKAIITPPPIIIV